MLGHHRPELVDLGVEGLQDRDLSGHDRRIGRLHRGGAVQLLGVQDLVDAVGLGLDVTPVRTPQRRGDLSAGQPARAGGVGCLGEQLEHVWGVQVGECLKGGGEEVPQRGPHAE
jgi:hypothetical protein